jgi:F-type H+-transporting ATPase subunit gamma
MANTKTIKTKMASVGNMRKITKAMEMVSRSKMKKSVYIAVNTRAYATRALELMISLSNETMEKNEFLTTPKNTDKVLIVHIASNKGLCGGYNASSLRALNSYLNRRSDEIEFITVGKYARRHAGKVDRKVLENFEDFPETPKVEDINELSDLVINKFLSGEYKKVLISYTKYTSPFHQVPTIRKILPLSHMSLKNIIDELGIVGGEENIGDDEIKNPKQYIYEPDEDAILNIVVPRLAKLQIYQGLLESNASEQSSRMVAMKNSTDNAEKMGKDLLLNYNKARQGSITKEILEIAAGADAVSG